MNPFAKLSEDAIASGLKNSGWKIVERNFRRRGSEIDIIAARENTLVFLEVKYRKSRPIGLSEVSQLLTHRKKIAMQRGANLFLERNQEYSRFCWRFDLVLTWPKSDGKIAHEYFVNAF